MLREPRFTPRRPFPPRPVRPPLAEPTIDWRIRTAVALFGARRLMTPRVQRRLELTGLTWETIAPILTRVRTIPAWAKEFDRAADERERAGDFRRAALLAFLGQLVLSPYHPEKSAMAGRMRRCHIRDRSTQPGIRFERLVLAQGAIVGYRETPERADLPPVLLLPPLASTKEELTLLADPFLAAGYPVIRLDLPGQGESAPPLTLETERLLMRALDEMGITPERGVIVGGISLGSYFALRLAGADQARVRGVFGISPPAVLTAEHWAKQHAIIWQYLDRYFATETRAATLNICLSLRLDGVIDRITCPARLYHAEKDPVSLPDAPERYRSALARATVTDRLLPDTHGCMMHLKDPIAPELVQWAASLPKLSASGTGSDMPGRF